MNKKQIKMKRITFILASILLLSSCGTGTRLYNWEKDEIRPIADAAICYGGHSARDPYLWTPERFEKTVAYTDENGQEHWLFDNMIMMELWDDDYAVTFSIANDGRFSSRKEHWQRQIEQKKFLAEQKKLKALEAKKSAWAVLSLLPKTK